MADKKKQSCSHTRQVKAYPPQRIYSLTQAYARMEEVSKSTVVEIALRRFFDSLSPEEKARVQMFAKNGY